MSEDFYEVLGVSRDADEEEIKRAYREKATEYHPDVSDDPDAEEKFKKIQKAKEVLSDEEKRQLYDRLGHEQFVQAEKHGGVDGAGAGGGPGGRAGPGGAQGNPFGGMGGMGGIGDLFEEFFGGGGNRPRQGDDVVSRIAIDLEDAYAGVEEQVTVERPERCGECDGTGHPPGAEERTCPECGGQGQVSEVRQSPLGQVRQTRTCRRCGGEGRLYDETCRACGGDGVTRERSTIEVDVPPGIRDGQTLRIEGEGAPGERGGPPGNLLVEVTVRDHDEFERDGDDLHYRQPVSFPQAVFGDTLQVPTIDGTAEFDLPSGTQSGETFRLEGKGMPHLQQGRRRRRGGQGDLFVHVQVVVPESLNGEQREALEAFAEAGGEEIDVEEGFFERIRNSL
ncbi:MAG: molecular chaperone DnaJ [Haloferacaceae archaeon]